MRILTLIGWMLACLSPPNGMEADWNLMPQPARVTPGQGRLKIDRTFRVTLSGYTEPSLERAADRLIRQLQRLTGIPLSMELASGASHATLDIATSGASIPVQHVGEDESYRLEVTAARARIAAPNPLGAFRGLATLVQLVEADRESFAIPAVRIEDRPRFPWRGTMINVCRHWLPIDVVERNIDAMAAVKLNVFHWHLSDDQGFRVESKLFPKLQEMGSDGHYFTQQQVRDVIEYARDRGIRVVPEFDMPGHATSWFAGYPELASGPGPYAIERGFGVFDPAMDPTREETYSFLDRFIGEMASLFPDDYFHIGGDEVNGKQWDANPRIQSFMREHGIKDKQALQLYFSSRVQPIVARHGKKVIGWDEVLAPGLPKDTMVQSWRGQKSLAQAARLGHSGILSAGYYLDLMQPASLHYAADPMDKESASLSAEEKARILGGESCLWSEYVTPENADMKIWPRNAAIAERLWSPQDVTDPASMYRRLAAVSRQFELLGMRHEESHRLMLTRLAGNHSIAPLTALSDVLEPVKEYAREEMRKYTSFTPLNRLVDATRPESDVARELGNLVDRALAGGTDDELRRWFSHWKANDAALALILEDSFLLQEAIPLSKDLAALGAAGLEALDYLTTRRRPPGSWIARQHLLLDSAAKPRAETLLMIVEPVRKLARAAAGE